MRTVRVRAPAKINWTLEVVGKRPDGYHEVRTVYQTVALFDWITITPAENLSLSLHGDAAALAGELIERNLAYRAAALLRERTGRAYGARIELEKHVPVAAGLGGGSSDAAAVLRGLRELWQLDFPDERLAPLAAELGSDVPFFLRGGTMLASGRGDALAVLPDSPPHRLLLAWPERPEAVDKTARMYTALRPEHHSDGSRTERLAERLRHGGPVRDEDIFNVFEAVLGDVDPRAADLLARAADLDLGKPHLCGSGPALFLQLDAGQNARALVESLSRLGLRATEAQTITTAGALAFSEVR